jgi:hypothetical protein
VATQTAVETTDYDLGSRRLGGRSTLEIGDDIAERVAG